MTEETPSRLSLRRLSLNAAILSLCWLVLSGHYDPFHLGLGMFSVALVLFLNRDFLREPVGAPTPMIRPVRFLLYTFWLGKEMILSAISVTRAVLSPRMNISPGLVRFRSDQPNDLARVVLGNSITLTPGTLTLDIEGDSFLVHHLTNATAEDLLQGRMQQRVAELFGPTRGKAVYEVERL